MDSAVRAPKRADYLSSEKFVMECLQIIEEEDKVKEG